MNMTSSLKSSLKELTGSSGEAVAEGARRATGKTVSPEAARHDPEVVAIARRRKFSGSEKRRLLAEAERCKEAGSRLTWINAGGWQYGILPIVIIFLHLRPSVPVPVGVTVWKVSPGVLHSRGSFFWRWEH